MGNSTRRGVKRRGKEKKQHARPREEGQADGWRTPAPPVGFLPLRIRRCRYLSASCSTPTPPPRNFSRCPSTQTSPFNRLLECRGLFLTWVSTSSLSLHAAGCSLEWHFTSESLSHAGSSSPSGSRTRFFFLPLFICGSASARCKHHLRRNIWQLHDKS